MARLQDPHLDRRCGLQRDGLLSYSLENRSAIITGANRGLGLEIARAYVRAGANVLMTARDARLLEDARAEVTSLTRHGQTVLAESGDVSDPGDVDRWVKRALDAFPRVAVLVNNAGTLGPMGAVEDADWSAWTRVLEVNLYGSVLMCRALLPHFKENGYGKIVQLSGGGATSPLPRITAYAASKAAVVRFAESLAEEVRESGIRVNAISPGVLTTQMIDQVLDAGPDASGPAYYERMVKTKAEGGSSPAVAADLAVFLGAPESDDLTGKIISAPWDKWEELPQHVEQLKKSDIYTVRRIVPKDRGQNWGDR